MIRSKKIFFMTRFVTGGIFLSCCGIALAADGVLEELSRRETVFSRLIVVNRCYRDVKVVTENVKGQKPRWVRARNTERFELWPGTRTPNYAYTLTRDKAPALNKTLKAFIAESEKTSKQLGDIFYYDHTYTLCASEADLDAPDAEFARPATKGEMIDVFRTYLTQVPESRDIRFAYRHYPIRFFLDNYPVFMTYSDNQGNVEIPLARGTQGYLGIVGHAFKKNRGRALYKEWTPIRSFTAEGGETVYRLPEQRNPNGW